jgi:hypothetical protein
VQGPALCQCRISDSDCQATDYEREGSISLEPPSEEAPQNRTVGYCHKYRAARTKSSPNEAALVASIQFGNRTIGLISISGRMFSEPTPRLSHFDQEKPVLGIRRRARLLKTAHRISLIIFCGAHCFPVRVGLKGNTMRPIQFRKLGQQARN